MLLLLHIDHHMSLQSLCNFCSIRLTALLGNISLSAISSPNDKVLSDIYDSEQLRHHVRLDPVLGGRPNLDDSVSVQESRDTMEDFRAFDRTLRNHFDHLV